MQHNTTVIGFIECKNNVRKAQGEQMCVEANYTLSFNY